MSSIRDEAEEDDKEGGRGDDGAGEGGVGEAGDESAGSLLGTGDEACGLAVGDDGGGVGGVEGGGEEVELEPSGVCVWTANSWTSYKYSYR
jgi:hypothetical protein